MALPKIEHKLYEHYLTGMKKTIKFRPFTVAEQKILLLAKEETKELKDSGMSQEVLSAVSQVLGNCTLGKVDVDAICTFDLEDLFLRLRAKSVGEVFDVRYRENYVDDNGAPQTFFIEITINLDEVKVQSNPEHTNKIPVTDKIGILMRYPTFKMLNECRDSDSLAMACIDSIWDGSELYSADVTPKEELQEFYESLETGPVMEIKKFFDTMPKLSHTVTVQLHDGTEKELIFEGLESFFA